MVGLDWVIQLWSPRSRDARRTSSSTSGRCRVLGQNGGSSELTPGVAHGSFAGAPPPDPPARAPWLCAGVAHGSLSEGLACPPPCWPPPYDEPPDRWVRVTLAVA